MTVAAPASGDALVLLRGTFSKGQTHLSVSEIAESGTHGLDCAERCASSRRIARWVPVELEAGDDVAVTAVEEIAEQIGRTPRTVRRLLALGMVREQRLTARRTGIHPAEREYLRRRWPELASLRAALRTTPAVRLAVLFGRAARDADAWEEGPIPLYVQMVGTSRYAREGLELGLSGQAGQAVRLHEAELRPRQRVPLWMLDVIDDGRVIVDRGGHWRECRQLRWSLQRRRDQEFSRSAARRTLPLEVFGNSDAKSTMRGYL